MNAIQTDAAGPVLSVRGITKRFGGVTALDGVSLELRSGEVHCLAGENGCGKSTLIKIISGVERPDAGEIIIDGETHSRMNATAAITSGVQVIYQDFSLFPNLSVAENIVLTAEVAGRQRFYRARAIRPKARAIVDELGLDLDLDSEVGELSVADKQLTAICRALVNEARVIIMDEPTTALTHSEVSRLFTVVERLRARGVAIVFVSHKLEEVLAISQRVTIMRSGRVVTSGLVADFDRRSIAQHMTGTELDETRVSASSTLVPRQDSGLASRAARCIPRRVVHCRSGGDRRRHGASRLRSHRDRRSDLRRATCRLRRDPRRRAARANPQYLGCDRCGHRLRPGGPPVAGPVPGEVDRGQHHRGVARSAPQPVARARCDAHPRDITDCP